tara:strand:- start:251 stop:490 length:240 start_codon:yes stop_codon:yes gene_type:complete
MKTVWNQLKKSYQDEIRKNTRKYSTAKILKYKLMAARGWHNLDINTIGDLLVYTDNYSYNVSGIDIMYGNKFLKEESND